MLHWYADSLGKQTGGYGHLYRKGDPITFTQEVANGWLENDLGVARKAAQKQFDQLPIQTQSLYDVLVSVNYQLGTDWYKDFKNTWKFMLEGNYQQASANAQMSKWFNQTPTRVKDFQKALQEAFLLNRQYQDLGL